MEIFLLVVLGIQFSNLFTVAFNSRQSDRERVQQIRLKKRNIKLNLFHPVGQHVPGLIIEDVILEQVKPRLVKTKNYVTELRSVHGNTGRYFTERYLTEIKPSIKT